MPFAKTHASKGLKKIMKFYRAGSWSPYGDKGAILYSRGKEVAKITNIVDWLEDHPQIFTSDSEYRRLTRSNPSRKARKSKKRSARRVARRTQRRNPWKRQGGMAALRRRYERAQIAYVANRTMANAKRVEKLRRQLEAAVLRRNPLPTLLDVGSGVLSGAEWAGGSSLFNQLAGGRKRKKKKPSRKGRKPRKSAKRNPARRSRQRQKPRRNPAPTHALKVGNSRSMAVGSKRQIHSAAHYLKKLGVKHVRIGHARGAGR